MGVGDGGPVTLRGVSVGVTVGVALPPLPPAGGRKRTMPARRKTQSVRKAIRKGEGGRLRGGGGGGIQRKLTLYVGTAGKIGAG